MEIAERDIAAAERDVMEVNNRVKAFNFGAYSSQPNSGRKMSNEEQLFEEA